MTARIRALPPFCVLDRYILQEFFRYYLLALGGFTAVVLLLDAIGRIDTFLDYDATPLQILAYYWNVLPYQALLVAPMAPLLATFLTLGTMTRFKELLAVKSAGISLYRLFAPLYVVGVLLAGVSFVVGEWVMPQANMRARKILNVDIKKRSGRDLGSRINVTYLGQGNRFFVIRRYDVPRQTMVEPMIQEFDHDRLTRRLDAASATYQDSVWVLVRGLERTFDANGVESAVPFDTLRVRFPETPADFAKTQTDPSEMSFPQLLRYTRRVRASGSDVASYQTELQLRVAFPFANLVVILIASSLAAQMRKGGIALGFGFSLAIAFAYWSLVRAGQVLGENGNLPPLAAAWLGNVIFLGLGAVLLVRTPK